MLCAMTAAACALTTIAPASARALDANTITSPSGANHCHWYGSIPHARIPEAGVVCTSTAGPRAGWAVVLTETGRSWKGYAAHRWLFQAGPRLAYGRAVRAAGIVCRSTTSGLTCTNSATRGGIFVSKQRHERW